MQMSNSILEWYYIKCVCGWIVMWMKLYNFNYYISICVCTLECVKCEILHFKSNHWSPIYFPLSFHYFFSPRLHVYRDLVQGDFLRQRHANFNWNLVFNFKIWQISDWRLNWNFCNQLHTTLNNNEKNNVHETEILIEFY